MQFCCHKLPGRKELWGCPVVEYRHNYDCRVWGHISLHVAWRIIAVILMIFGIGLISMLTGTITTYFANRSKERSKNTATENDCRELLEIAKVLEPDQLEKLTDIAKIIKGDGMPSNP